jgi:hypothetical protein
MPFSEIARIGPPHPVEIEISIFGPNYGECVVAHLGGGHWLIVDSCVCGDNREAVALGYFRALGIDPAQAIKAIVVTHWHDDHCKGVAQLLRAAPDAHLCISHALTDSEFLKFAARMRKNHIPVAGTKLQEFSEAIGEIRRRNDAGLVNFNFAQVRTSVYNIDATKTGHGLPCEVIALSPSNGDSLQFLQRIGEMMPSANASKISISAATPNDVSVVILVKIGELAILLGADLENSGKQTSGWEAVLNNHRAFSFGPKAALFKIGHHGSETAYNSSVWAELVLPGASSALTPWKRGRGFLPTADGVKKILTHTDEAYTTVLNLSSDQRKDRPVSVKRQLRESKVKLRDLSSEFGAVRFRMSNPSSGHWQTELFGAASPLKNHLRKQR